MSLKLGNQEVTKVMLGSTEVSAVYKGADEVWSAGGGGEDWVFTNLGNEGITASGANLYDVVHNGNVWATTGYVGAFATSEDGINWSSTGVYLLPEEDDPELQRTLGDNNFRGIVWTGYRWVVAGSKGYCTTSQDGVNWTTSSGLATAVEDNIIYGMATNLNDGEEIIACSANGLAGRSTNGGLSWSKVTLSAAGGNFYAVKHNGTHWCAVGNACAATSTNGTNWTAKNSGLPNIKAVASNGTVWCGVGLQGLCLTSTDGLNWVQNSGLSDVMTTGFSCRNISGVKDLFVAVGGGGQVATSKDGVTWKKEKSTGTSELYGVLVNDLGTVACSNNSEVAFNPSIKAPPPPPPGPWGTEALSGQRYCYFELQQAGVTFPTDNFTVELWFKSFGGPNHGSYASLFGAWSHPRNNGWMVGYNMNNNDSTQDISVMHIQYSDTYQYKQIANNAMTSWTHFAMVKIGGTIYFYINGVNVKAVSASSYTWGGHTQFYCGGSGIRDAAFGTYSNFRISNVARYTQNFTRPATHFEPDANTLVLAHQGSEFKDYSGNNVNMVQGTGCKITQDSPWSARDTYSKVANAQLKAAAVKEAVADKVKNSKDIKDDG